MTRFLKIAALAAEGFFRAGRHFPQAGVVIPVSDLTEADLERIMAEPNLHVQPAEDAEPEALSDDGLAAAIKAAIATLEGDGFDQKGKPKLDALRAALPDAKDRITAEMRDAIWAELKPAE